MLIFKISFRNVLRNKRRTLITLLSIIIGIVSITVYSGFITYSMWGLRESTIRNGLGHLQISTDEKFFLLGSFDPYSFLIKDYKNVERKIMSIPEVKTVVPEITFSATLAGKGRSAIAMVEAFPSNISSDVLSFRNIIEGRDIIEDTAREIVLGRGVAEKLGVKVGDILTIMGVTKGGGLNAMDVEVVGISSSGLREIDNMYAYMGLKAAKDFLFVQDVPLLVVLLEKTEYTDKVYNYLVNQMIPVSKEKLFVKKWDELADYYNQAKGFYDTLLSVIRLIVILIVIFAILNTMVMSVFERVREIGTMRAIGTKKSKILLMFMLEGTIIGLIGGVTGVAIGFGLCHVINMLGGIYIPPPPGMNEGYRALFTPPLRSIWENIILAFVVSIIGSIYPALRSTKFSIADALRYI